MVEQEPPVSDIKFAVDQARREERLNARLDNHDAEIRDLRKAQIETSSSVMNIAAQVARIEQAIGEQIAVAKALADNAARGLTSKNLYIALGLFLVALAGLILGAHGGPL